MAKPKFETCVYMRDDLLWGWPVCAWVEAHQMPEAIPMTLDRFETDEATCRKCKCWEPKEKTK